MDEVQILPVIRHFARLRVDNKAPIGLMEAVSEAAKFNCAEVEVMTRKIALGLHEQDVELLGFPPATSTPASTDSATAGSDNVSGPQQACSYLSRAPSQNSNTPLPEASPVSRPRFIRTPGTKQGRLSIDVEGQTLLLFHPPRLIHDYDAEKRAVPGSTELTNQYVGHGGLRFYPTFHTFNRGILARNSLYQWSYHPATEKQYERALELGRVPKYVREQVRAQKAALAKHLNKLAFVSSVPCSY